MTLQQQIKHLAAQLEELAQQVAQPELEQGAVLDQVLRQAKNNPFEHHVVAAYDDYVKGLYIQALLSIVQQSEVAQMERYGLVVRIYYAFALSESFEQCVTKSQLLTLEDISSLYNVLRENELTETFLVDALMLLGIKQEPRIREYVTELVSNLMISQETFRRACLITRAILMVDEEALQQLFSKNRTLQEAAGHYLCAISSKFAVVVNIVGDGQVVVDLEECGARELYLENVQIKNSGAAVNGAKKLVLKNCQLFNEAVRLRFEGIEELVLDGLRFPEKGNPHDLPSTPSITIKNSTNLSIQNLQVENLQVEGGYLFDIQNSKQFVFLNNHFENVLMNLKDPSSVKWYAPTINPTIQAIIATENIDVYRESDNTLSRCRNASGFMLHEIEKIIYSK